MNLVSKTTALCLLTVCSIALSACNTMQGAGRDIQRSGDALEGAARDAL